MASRFSGHREMRAKFLRAVVQVPRRMGGGLYLVGQQEMTESKRLCPVWNPDNPVPKGHAPGSLRNSGRVSLPEIANGTVSVTLSYGGGDVDYAVYVHEDLEAFHATGEAKFLERPLKEAAPYILQRAYEKARIEDLFR